MAIESLDKLLNDFIEAWNTGQRPDVDDFLGRASEAERNELAGLIGAFLEIAPTPEYSAAQLDAIRSDPTVQRITKLVDGEAGLWPKLLERLRARARLTREQVVASLAGALGVTGQERKVHHYYHQMETGTLDPDGVSQKVLTALAKILGVSESELEPGDSAARFLAKAAPEPLYFRTDEVMEERLERAAEASGPPDPDDMDEVDRLFRGGR
jgi:hypothetical protein